jgi:DNA-directed RNA polymerase specialized sigma subunit
MKKILETLQIDTHKGTILFHSIEEEGIKYYEIVDHSGDETQEKKATKISVETFQSLVKAMGDFQTHFQKNVDKEIESISESDKQTLQEYYQSGATLQELATQLGFSEAAIEIVLRKKGTEIREGKLPKALIKKGGNLRRRRK